MELRKLQLVELKLLEAFKECCDKHGLTYYLSDGTLLGAVRHKGFIPWDDDIDVIMPWNDYKKFCLVAQDDLGNTYYVQNGETEDNYHLPYTKIRANGTTFMHEYLKCQKIHLGIWIDVFPLIETNEGLEFKLKKGIVRASSALQLGTLVTGHVEDFQKQVGKIPVAVLLLLSKLPVKFRKRLHMRILNHVCGSRNRTHYTVGEACLYDPMPKRIFDGDPVEVEFEGKKYLAPCGYEEYLTRMYGDYMTPPPPDKRVAHTEDAIIDTNKNYTEYL